MTLLMMGSHSLAELRDAICCVNDLQVCGEFSNTPDMAPDFISKVSKCTQALQDLKKMTLSHCVSTLKGSGLSVFTVTALLNCSRIFY